MLKLGYNEYGTSLLQSPALLTYHSLSGRRSRLGRLPHTRTRVSRSLQAHHVNMALARPPTEESHPELYAEMQKTPLTDWEKAGQSPPPNGSKNDGFAYYQIHGTRPQTIGYSVTDSPAGLLAWIWEKLHDWSDFEHYKWEDDEILTWISIYYFSTPGPAATQRIYFEEMHRKPHRSFIEAMNYLPCPLGIANFPKELSISPQLWHKTLGPVVHESVWDVGGHFSAGRDRMLLCRTSDRCLVRVVVLRASSKGATGFVVRHGLSILSCPDAEMVCSDRGRL